MKNHPTSLARRILKSLGATVRVVAAPTERTILVVTADPVCAREAFLRFTDARPARLLWVPSIDGALKTLKRDGAAIVVLDPGLATRAEDRLADFVATAPRTPVWLLADTLSPGARTAAVRNGAAGVLYRQSQAAAPAIPALRLRA